MSSSAEAPEKPTSQNQTSTQNSLDSARNEPGTADSKPGAVEKNQETKAQLSPEIQLFDNHVLQVGFHLQLKSISDMKCLMFHCFSLDKLWRLKDSGFGQTFRV